MFPSEYVLALALLTAPADAPAPAVATHDFAIVQSAIQKLAIERQLLDPREKPFVLARPRYFQADLAMLRQRYHELIDAPPVHDSLRFPDRAMVNDALAFNRAYRRQIDGRQPREPSRWWEVRNALDEADYLYEIWDNVRDARCEYYYITVRRQALKKLRELIGDQAYYNSQLPPYVPMWRFQEIN